MKRFLIGAVVALMTALGGVAHAQQANTGVGVYDGLGPYTTMQGKRMVITGTTTNNTFNWGFWSRAVQVCVHNQNINTGVAQRVNAIWMRPGSTLTDSTGAAIADPTGMTIVATTDALFENGSTSIPSITGPAAAISASASDGVQCQVYPIRVRGLITHSTVASTTDVTVFGGQTKSP